MISPPERVGRPLAVLLSLLTVFGPISMDLYLPVLPALTADLHAATSTAQLTLTACLLGLAGGQLIAGPISDRYGRRRPLLVGVGAYIAASLLCALSPTIEVLVAARLLQGLAGAVGIVTAQAAGRDLYSGAKLVRYYGRLTVLAGLAAIIGPLIGGRLAVITDWRGSFVFLAGIGLIIGLGCAVIFTETLHPGNRAVGRLGQTVADFRLLLGDRGFLAAVLVSGFLNAAIFSYLSGATFVLQGIYRLTPQQYSLAFGANSLGFMILGFLSGRLAGRWGVRVVLALGIGLALLGALGLLAVGLFGLPLPAVVASLITMVGGVALSAAPTTSLALSDQPRLAGTASSLLGLTRYGFGAVAAPLVGLAGPHTALPLGVVTTAAAGCAAVIYRAGIARR